MISSRERGFFQILVGLQVGLISTIYWGWYVILFYGVHGSPASFQSYVKYSIVIVMALIIEAVSRPTALRLSPGRVRKVAFPVARRQSIWIVASVMTLLVLSKDLAMSRIFFGGLILLSFTALFLTNRFIIRWAMNFDSKWFSKWKLRTMVLGPKEWCDSVIPDLILNKGMLDLKRVVWTDDENESKDYTKLVAEQPIDMLVMPPRHLPDKTVISLLRAGDKLGYRCWLPLELTRRYGRRFDLQKTGRLDVLSPPAEPLENVSNQVIKRCADIVFSLVMICTVIPPLCLLVWAIHRKYSPGPLFFKQDRVGKNGETFKVYKFRTLHVANGDETQQVTKSDNRIFKGGGMLRKTSIDEMPQFFNVLLGDMSVVGPRPHMEQHDEVFREIFERYGVRRYVKPGVTGLAQVKGYRGEVNRPLDLRNRARLDNFYVSHWDLSMDLKIVMMTGLSMVKPPKTAY
ncbi:sugar transferase [Luteolibacter algae]|uniref:Sugar transferase n=1 Tax=Luteolibacter algae TaxID=454151 RepID=A0ABW5D6T8_9BACT